jgi:23S rRNA (adenine2030-N6)-methyltransferase
MNYRHAYHAGNFADLLKHAVLALVIEHLKLKPAPFRVIDTHSGIGLYDLGSEAALKTGEWRAGIGRVIDAELPADAAAAITPYLAVVREVNGTGPLKRYPGSPLIARRLMRASDRLFVNELHPEDHAELAKLFARDAETKVLELDGWTALKSLLPPKERRGVVLVDPAFEEEGELGRLVKGLQEAVRRFATGTFVLWYPIKDPKAIAAFRCEIAGLGLPKVLAVELMIRAADDTERLNGAGLIVVNPPYTLEAKLKALLPALVPILAQGDGARSLLHDLAPQDASLRKHPA